MHFFLQRMYYFDTALWKNMLNNLFLHKVLRYDEVKKIAFQKAFQFNPSSYSVTDLVQKQLSFA